MGNNFTDDNDDDDYGDIVESDTAINKKKNVVTDNISHTAVVAKPKQSSTRSQAVDPRFQVPVVSSLLSAAMGKKTKLNDDTDQDESSSEFSEEDERSPHENRVQSNTKLIAQPSTQSKKNNKSDRSRLEPSSAVTNKRESTSSSKTAAFSDEKVSAVVGDDFFLEEAPAGETTENSNDSNNKDISQSNKRLKTNDSAGFDKFVGRGGSGGRGDTRGRGGGRSGRDGGRGRGRGRGRGDSSNSGSGLESYENLPPHLVYRQLRDKKKRTFRNDRRVNRQGGRANS